jgi:1-hydroxycarotenoid 3,4-desaturase
VQAKRVIIIGSGVGGLVAAAELAAAGHDVQVFEAGAKPGGKMREIVIDGHAIDSGPTVFTMKWVFDEVFAAAGARLGEHLRLTPLRTLARHAWSDGTQLDLHAEKRASIDAISAFAGAAEGRRYANFCAEAERVFQTLDGSFIRNPNPSPLSLVRNVGLRRIDDLMASRPFSTLWSALGAHFHDARLRQLFGRYATYCGASPFLAPATLMLIAHVEQAGVWTVDGGMHQVARALEALGRGQGARYHYQTPVTEIIASGGRAIGVRLADGQRADADAIIFNGDVSALGRGLLGDPATTALRAIPAMARSLSAITWSLVARTSGFPLVRHTVVFSKDYVAEFSAIFKRHKLPEDPTIYICAQDRGEAGDPTPDRPERLLVLVNAPATGDGADGLPTLTDEEIARCEAVTFRHLAAAGLTIERTAERTVRTTPADFARLFPATGGALYGRASHGWTASFSRPAVTTRIQGLYVAGGSAHPGPGVPMAAMSGRMAAQRVHRDLASTRRYRSAAISGGMSMR